MRAGQYPGVRKGFDGNAGAESDADGDAGERDHLRTGDGKHMPGQDAKFAESAGAGGGDVRQDVGLGEQVAGIAIDLGEDDQSDGEISGRVEDDRKQG